MTHPFRPDPPATRQLIDPERDPVHLGLPQWPRRSQTEHGARLPGGPTHLWAPAKLLAGQEEDLGNPSRKVPGGPRTSKRRPGGPTRGPQSPGAGRSPERMGSRPPETGAGPGAAAGGLEDGARRGGPFRLE